MSKVDAVMAELKKVNGLDWVAIFTKRYHPSQVDVLASWWMYGWDEDFDLEDYNVFYEQNRLLFNQLINQGMSYEQAIKLYQPNDEAGKAIHQIYEFALAEPHYMEALHTALTDWWNEDADENQQWYFCYAVVRNHLFKEESFPGDYSFDLHTAAELITDYLMGERDMDAWLNYEGKDFTQDFCEFLAQLFYEEYELPRSITDDDTDMIRERFTARIYASHDLAQLNRQQRNLVLLDIEQEEDPSRHNEVTRSFYTTMEHVVNVEAYAYFLLRHGYHEHW